MKNVLQLRKNQILTDSFDLKGSTYKRYTDAKEVMVGAPKKDMNAIEQKL